MRTFVGVLVGFVTLAFAGAMGITGLAGALVAGAAAVVFVFVVPAKARQ